jgi:two-component system sensor histidine kinase KdpD
MPHSPDYFLQLIKQSRRGRLKVYIGMIAGVGKTYRMLLEAHRLKQAGENVGIGYIETHGRLETEALLAGLPVISRKKVFYKGKELEEMDMEAILTERPSVVIVDELAHSNIPGSKNEKRWQDVQDLIQTGINVITAFNVQHLESLNDKVYTVSGIEVSERIPDTFLAEADEVVNIDMPAGELIQRLREGKIYKGERIQTALENFFREEQILQLRELALLQVAKNLERKIEEANENKTTVVERFMACISTNEKMASRVIRKTARLAMNYKASWFVVYVQSEKESALRIESRLQTRLLYNMKTAAELGARVIKRQTEGNIPDTLFRTALEQKATNIVIGRPNQGLWRTLTANNIFSKLVRKISGTDMDLIVVT